MEPEPQQPSRAKRRFAFWAFSSLLILFGIAVAIPNFVRARSTSCQNACINNLRQIEGAKEQWALEKKKPDGSEVTQEDVAPYIKGGWPKCPGSNEPGKSAGSYTIGKVGESPRCSVPEHYLPAPPKPPRDP